MSDEQSEPQFLVPKEPPPHGIAFVIDGVVQEKINTFERFATVLLSDPVIVFATGVDAVIGQTTYDPETGVFTHPDESTQTAAENPFEV